MLISFDKQSSHRQTENQDTTHQDTHLYRYGVKYHINENCTDPEKEVTGDVHHHIQDNG